MAVPFSDMSDTFQRITTETVWCSLTTLDAHNRPRSRIIHPIWEVVDEQPVGWLATRRSPVKTAHLAHSQHVSCAYWRPTHDAVLLQCTAAWEDRREEKERIWHLFAAAPPPLGYDPRTIWTDGPEDPEYAVLRFEAWRVQIVTVETLTNRRAWVWTSATTQPRRP
jgi:general stress protein 26